MELLVRNVFGGDGEPELVEAFPVLGAVVVRFAPEGQSRGAYPPRTLLGAPQQSRNTQELV